MGITGGDKKRKFGMRKRGPLAKNIYNSDGKYKKCKQFLLNYLLTNRKIKRESYLAYSAWMYV